MKRIRLESDDERKARTSFATEYNAARIVTRRPFQKRFEVTVEGVSGREAHNVSTATEALRIARLHSTTGSEVFVRDRSRRMQYFDEPALEALAKEEADGKGA